MSHSFIPFFNDAETRPTSHIPVSQPTEPSASAQETGTGDELSEAARARFCGKWTAALLRRNRQEAVNQLMRAVARIQIGRK